MGEVISYDEFIKFKKERDEIKEITEDLKEIRNLIREINNYNYSKK